MYLITLPYHLHSACEGVSFLTPPTCTARSRCAIHDQVRSHSTRRIITFSLSIPTSDLDAQFFPQPRLRDSECEKHTVIRITKLSVMYTLLPPKFRSHITSRQLS